MGHLHPILFDQSLCTNRNQTKAPIKTKPLSGEGYELVYTNSKNEILSPKPIIYDNSKLYSQILSEFGFKINPSFTKNLFVESKNLGSNFDKVTRYPFFQFLTFSR